MTVEMWKDLAFQARSNLKRQGISNVESHVGDCTLKVLEPAPFDAILVSAA
ncbi:MAG TPA: hypothetical protein VE569_06445 [Acidimicrobiia bacterium]|nr:hypothetical protein [Acidimicrobiia bacterium]